MIKKLLRNIKKLLSSRNQVKKQPVRLRNRKPYISVPAEYPTPYDPWFDTQVKSAKQRLVDKMLGLEKLLWHEQKKESENIHEELYNRSSQHWATWTEGISDSGNGMNSSGAGR